MNQYLSFLKHLLFIIITTFLCTCYDSQKITLPGADIQLTVGYADNTELKSKIFFVHVPQDENTNQQQALTLWLNGGPGCSSMYGFLQEIGPYILGLNVPYKQGDPLKKNQFGWNKHSNMLFFDSPAGVGYSYSESPEAYKYGDQNSAKDLFNALQDFLAHNSQLSNLSFYIAGESYAGKYIPDLAVKISSYNLMNPDSQINLKGIYIVNGVLNWNTFDSSQVKYMISHNFIDPKLIPYWENSCGNDQESAGCQYFYARYEELLWRTNPYYVYGLCSNKTMTGKPLSTQGSLLKRLQNKFSKKNEMLGLSRFQYCSYDYGLIDYFNINKEKFGSKNPHPYLLCNDDVYYNYNFDPRGSVNELAKLISNTNITIYYLSGDWDEVVPYDDNFLHFKEMGLTQDSIEPWIENNQNFGMKRIFSQGSRKLTFYMIKKAGHEVPMYQRQASLKLFKYLIDESSKK